MNLPGYKSVSEFSRQVGISNSAALRHVRQGYCEWPRRSRNNQTKHPLYYTWINMKRRVYDVTHPAYANYGGRGIQICTRWYVSFENFCKDVGEKPRPEYTLDRINNEGNYTPENCRWATRLEQNNNRSVCGGTISVAPNGKFKAEITVWGNRYYLGTHLTKDLAQESIDKITREN